MPKYNHSCDNCRFLGTYFDHDVYVCHNSTVLARYGDHDSDYASMPIKVFLQNLHSPDHLIGIEGTENMPYQEYIFSTYAGHAEKAVLLALAIDHLEVLLLCGGSCVGLSEEGDKSSEEGCSVYTG